MNEANLAHPSFTPEQSLGLDTQSALQQTVVRISSSLALTRHSGAEPSVQLQPLAQLLAGTRSLALARLATLRLTQMTNEMRNGLAATTVDYAHRMLFAEEEVVAELALNNALNFSPAAMYCQLHVQLDQLLSIETRGDANASSNERWEMMLSELIGAIQQCAGYVQDIFANSKTADSDGLVRSFHDVLDTSIPASNTK